MTARETEAANFDMLRDLTHDIFLSAFGEKRDKRPVIRIDFFDGNRLAGFVLAVNLDYLVVDDHEVKNLIQKVRSAAEERSPAIETI
jgi:hypothetical protein